MHTMNASSPATAVADRAATASAPVDRNQTQRAWAEWAFLVPFAGRVLALQGMHPVVSAGLMDHSSILEDPWQRSIDTIAYGLRSIYDEDPLGVAREIRELHRPIQGRLEDGSRYHAWNAEAWAWVHLSTFEATVYARRAIGRALSESDRRALYAEWRAAGRNYGVAERLLPIDLAAFDRYAQEMIDHRLVATPVATRLYHETLRHLPAPAAVPGMRLAWPLVGPLAGPTAQILTAGAFPAVLRERLGIPWTPARQAGYRAVLAALAVSTRVLPAAVTQFPMARAVHPNT